ncbi:hypothetical protein CDD80_415 [Ophiocordyceps camponoti-rufipedis]|uniref:ATPase synthesis protein 25 n=1 Tax=Ophiocordyceps camponoti-rufipedis TaxID=2004952 RepID=A0A2C5YJX3_9HYPO|nr:hypothetical protein CDD80_415 [Ophiocordyceps camponoti-rufipedis]
MAALRCCACRSAVLGAVVGRAAPVIPGFPRPFLPAAVRALSRPSDKADARDDVDGISEKLSTSSISEKASVENMGRASREVNSGEDEASAEHDEASTDGPEAASKEDEPQSKPWFLKVDPPSKPWTPHQVTLPKLPEDSPSLLEPMMQYVYDDMGLDDLALLDLRELDPSASLGPSLIMMIATARSGRHLHVSAGRFVRWLRRNHGVRARGDGLIGSALLRTKLRRLRKRAKLMGTNSMVLPQGDHGLTTDWVCVTFSTGPEPAAEVEKYDASGRLSGFNREYSGTTIAVQCLTEQRRKELDLEGLWQEQLRASVKRQRSINGLSYDSEEIESLVSSKLQLPRPTFSSAFQGRLHEPPQQKRAFSTLARRLHQTLDDGQSFQPESPQAVPADELAKLRQQVQDVQLRGLSMDSSLLTTLLISALTVDSPRQDTESERLSLVDELLLTGQERGLTIDSPDMVVSLIAAVVLSPAYNDKMAQAQRNLEAMLRDKQSPPQEQHTLRLLHAYGCRGQWAEFTDAFRTPARFQLARSVRVYEQAYRSLAAWQSRVLCGDFLRWMYPDMLRESPPVTPVGPVLDWLRNCILLADPRVLQERQLYSKPSELGGRRAIRSEFKVMLNDVMERHFEATQGSTVGW